MPRNSDKSVNKSICQINSSVLMCCVVGTRESAKREEEREKGEMQMRADHHFNYHAQRDNMLFFCVFGLKR